jgi:hypothetical protein
MAYNEDEETFAATAHFKATGSSFVEEVAYDLDTHELLVLLDSGSGYLYKGVEPDTFRKFESAHSRGQFYNNWIKRGNYGPGTEIDWAIEIVDKTVPTQLDASKSYAVGEWGERNNSPWLLSNTTSVSGAAPFSLTVSEPNKVTHFPNATFSLAAPEPPVEEFTYSHEVSYTVGNSEYSTSVDAGKGVFDGIDIVVGRLEALGLPFEIKGVYVTVNE